MYMVAYGRDRQKMMQSGWGCGYLMIPNTHPVIINFIAEKAKPPVLDEDGYDSEQYTRNYLNVNVGKEITYTAEETVNGITYTVIGFDTAQAYHNETHDFKWVFNATVEMKRIIDSL